MNNPFINIYNVSYSFSNGTVLFRNLFLSFGLQKIGIIGNNGIGKTILLQLIAGVLRPVEGAIQMRGNISYCPQNMSLHNDKTIAEVLGIYEKLQALRRITTGSIDEKDYEILDEDWEIERKTMNQLIMFRLEKISLDRTLKEISGGERSRLWIAKSLSMKPDFLILDEPTNNLDLESRAMLYNMIRKWERGLIVVSHDRNLLGLMDKVVELSNLGAKVYGGNYNYYEREKKVEKEAAQRNLNEARKQINKTKFSIQKTREKHEQKQASGRALRRSGSQAKLILNSMRERSQKTQNLFSLRDNRMLNQDQKRLKKATEKIEDNSEIFIDIPNTSVPYGKIVVKLEKVIFSYFKGNKPMIYNFNLNIQGQERIALTGANGSGKTTLVKLIQQEIKPIKGSVYVGVSSIAYLDQYVHGLDEKISVLENCQQYNPVLSETKLRLYLAQFLFKNTDALKLVGNLSGGERLRALLACVFISHNPPQLIILDEPTNHLDLKSIRSLESALNCYKGAMIVISHDKKFLENIKVTKSIQAPFWGTEVRV